MFQLMTSIYENHRLIQVLGLRGIGKTNLIKGALNYIYERKQFGGGIIYINIKNTREYLRLISQVLLTIQRT
jgi:predicted AAA+ superfamily ATPase